MDTDFKKPIMEGDNEVLKGLKTTYKKESEVIGIAYKIAQVISNFLPPFKNLRMICTYL